MTANTMAYAPADIIIREIERPDEIRAVEELQKEVWGLPDLDVVPFTQLVAARAAGGVLIGAFDARKLVGFAYGFVGHEDGGTTHHSHMLAVKPEYRNYNLGYRLKSAQRDFVLAQGITEMTWTFDPLQSLNAYFNFGRLGVVSDRYLIDFYGTDAASFLHRNGTDRLWVTWHLASRRVVERLEGNSGELSMDENFSIVSRGDNDLPVMRDLDITRSGDQLSIEIPTDIRNIEEQDPEIAAAWRLATRTAFTGAFAASFTAVEFIRGHNSGRYILRRKAFDG